MKRTLVSLAAVVTLALAGCGSDATTSGGGEGSAGTTSSAQPVAEVGDTVSAKELGERTNEAMREAGTVKMTMVDGGDEMTGELSYADGVAYKLTGMSDGEPMEMIYVDKVLYMGGDSFAEMTGGKRFIKIDPDGEDLMSAMLAPLLGVLEQAANPASVLGTLEGVDSTVIAVDGDQVTYETKLTADQLKAATEKLLGTELPPEAAAEIEDATMEQTVDAEGRLTKVVTKAASDTTVTYSDHGAPVDVSAPADSEVGTLDMDSFMDGTATP